MSYPHIWQEREICCNKGCNLLTSIQQQQWQQKRKKKRNQQNQKYQNKKKQKNLKFHVVWSLIFEVHLTPELHAWIRGMYAHMPQFPLACLHSLGSIILSIGSQYMSNICDRYCRWYSKNVLRNITLKHYRKYVVMALVTLIGGYKEHIVVVNVSWATCEWSHHVM